MNLALSPSSLSGTVTVPPSKSLAHRAVIAAALSKGDSEIQNLALSNDIRATMRAMENLGAVFSLSDAILAGQPGAVRVSGIQSSPQTVEIDCGESGSTLRFLIPVAAALGVSARFAGKGKLPERPIMPYLESLPAKGITFDYANTMPFSISGQLQSGTFVIDGGISSQFVTGLLFALPLLEQGGIIQIRGRLESKPYADMTMDVLGKFGIQIFEKHGESAQYIVEKCQNYTPCIYRIENDYSQAAFFGVAGALSGPITLVGLPENSRQGDRAIFDILQQAGAEVLRQGDTITVSPGSLHGFSVDVSDIPDLVPVLTVLACACQGKTRMTGAARLKIKESDRLTAIADCLNRIGGHVRTGQDWLEIDGGPRLSGGTVSSFNDHRIAMSAGIAALYADGPVILQGAESVQKSYPGFWEDYKGLGGKADVVALV
ncbi:MAG TPA: 3-phosphoshikimate 1-carboxyvinyltransferase [Firmicutes bacterium]|nr:3-phosphoshikimate 1-carboxyvinyltransferase [Bacillota bacterium]